MLIEKFLKNASNKFKQFKLKEAFEILRLINVQYPNNVKVREFFEKHKSQIQNKLVTKLPEIIELQSKKNYEEKLKAINTFLKSDSQNSYLLALLGDLFRENKNFEKSKEFYQKAIYLNPYEPIFYINYSITLIHLSQFDNSIVILNFAKLINPSDINIDILLARNYAKALNFEESYKKFEYIISQETNADKYKIEYSNLLLKNNNIQKATNIIENIKIINENEIEVLLLKGILKLKENSYHEAKEFFENASRLNPNLSRPYTFLGIAHKNLLDFESAIKFHLKALDINKKNYISLHNLGIIYAIIGDTKNSIIHFKEVISINPNYHESKYLLGQLQVMNKDFKDGWINFESRWHFHKYPHKKLVTKKPLLHKLDEKIKLLVWKEQGIGDQIMYASMFNELVDKVSKLIVLIDKRLIKIFIRNHPKVKFISSIDEVKDENYDFHIPFGNIGLFLRNKHTDFYQSYFPYASSNPKLTSILKKKYRNKNKIVIGISWTSSNQILGDAKSIAIKNFEPIFLMPNLIFIDLQYVNSEEDRKYVLRNYNVKIHNEIDIDKYNDLESLASLIDICDLIITCSNVNAHLAGALNKKTCLLLPLGKGRLWNWSERNNKSVWYPSINVFQQKYTENWEHPIKQTKQEIFKCQNV